MLPPDEPPTLYHSLQQRDSSVLSLAADANHIYSGSQGDDINVSQPPLIHALTLKSIAVKVWDKTSFRLKTALKGHTASVLALTYAPELQWLFSASGTAYSFDKILLLNERAQGIAPSE